MQKVVQIHPRFPIPIPFLQFQTVPRTPPREVKNMKLKDVKVGTQYETKFGVGKCLEIDAKNSPPAARFHITRPLPRGLVWIKARDVICEAPES
jgi:hypothetical protein